MTASLCLPLLIFPLLLPLSTQIKPVSNGISGLEYYLRKNFYKTASLMGHSCLSAAVLGNGSDAHKRASYLYGIHIGQAFQLVDDALDFEGTLATLGKESYADLRSGIATAPTLFAADEFPELVPMIGRKFEQEGDVETALELVIKSQGAFVRLNALLLYVVVFVVCFCLHFARWSDAGTPQ